MTHPQEIIDFWLDEVGPKGWFEPPEGLDDDIRERFGGRWKEASEGGLGLWLTTPQESPAYLILTDQFPRNMFRGEARAFATDQNARAAAKVMISREWDLRLEARARPFVYLPLEHSENIVDQDRAVALFAERLPEDTQSLLHARAHREIIRRFGRFPFRNAALARRTTEAEQRFLDEGGYGAIVRALQAEQGDAAPSA
ncbi:DUF924 family protein [Histidinibacterium aquaticum]|uniref:DUF924 domain-containing protein n=1 Tax=Histidinibacterium aquaticum TaxID=2613962 RepID=A0A5J5GMY6_9RHOB|nr:DUF924 family protein [Histidinibacterium aquaticum]KAA9008978.1 DUF924 domain-containing protein [Histidinibacterium aquaticum]